MLTAMKTQNLILFSALILAISIFSCERKCKQNNTGVLALKNSSSVTHRILIDGVDEGTIKAGKSQRWDLEVGEHTLQWLIASTGEKACTGYNKTIELCKTSSWQCDSDGSRSGSGSGSGDCPGNTCTGQFSPEYQIVLPNCNCPAGTTPDGTDGTGNKMCLCD